MSDEGVREDTGLTVPCRLCREPLPAQYGGAYSDEDDPSYLARIYCCPTCIVRLGWVSAYQRATSLVRNDRGQQSLSTQRQPERDTAGNADK